MPKTLPDRRPTRQPVFVSPVSYGEIAVPTDEREELRGMPTTDGRDTAGAAGELASRLSPEAEAIRSARPDIPAPTCEILAMGWRSYGFSPADISAWLLADFEPDRDWFAAALRAEGVTPSMLTRFYRRRGTRQQEQLIAIVSSFAHDQRNPAALTHLLDRWGVQRQSSSHALRAG
jgi:hypothetical protein